MSSFSRMEVLGRASEELVIKTNDDGSPKLATFRVSAINKYGEIQVHKVVVKDPYIINVVQNYVKPNYIVDVRGDFVINRWTDSNGNQNTSYELVATEVYSFPQQKSEKYNNVTQF